MKTKLLTLLITISSYAALAQQPLFEQLTVENGLGSNNVYAVKVTVDGEVWVATDKHICLFQGLNFLSYPVKDSSLTGLFLDPKGGIWAYSSNGNIYNFNGAEVKKVITGAENLLQTNLINTIAFEKHNTFWVSTIIKGELIRVKNQQADNISIPKESGYFVKELSNGNFISGTGNTPNKSKQLYVLFTTDTITISLTQKGLGTKSSFLALQDSTFLFAKDFELIHFDKKQVLNRVFVEKNITSLYQDSKGKLWIGLYNGGLICYPNAAISSPNAITYLGANSITSITEDLSNNIWVGTLNNGVYYLPEQQTIKYSAPHFFSDTGVVEKQTIGIQSTIISEKSSPSDLRIINTQSSIYDSIPPTIYIKNIKIMNKDTAIQNSYLLPYNKNFLLLSFIGFSYKNPEKIQYRYKMIGVDKNWTYTNNTSVQYTTLPPGKYQFIVSSMNKNGIWSDTEARLNFEITPPFWETWWFILLLITIVTVFSSSILYLWIKAIKEKERAKSEINKKIASIELRALRAQMNPHFMFNTMSSIQHYITTNETESALRYLSKFSKLMRKILDNSKKATITVKDEIDSLELYLSLEKLRFKTKLNYHIEIDPSIDQNYDEIPTMLIQPYVENAIIHGINHQKKEGIITIYLTRENNYIKCTITDNGIGRKRSSQINKSRNNKHTSSGMSITKERLNILNEAQGNVMDISITDLTDETGRGCGTKIEIYIPTEN